jgi:hypothetical protein
MDYSFKEDLLDLMSRTTLKTDEEINNNVPKEVSISGFDNLKVMFVTSAGRISGKVSDENFVDYPTLSEIDITSMIYKDSFSRYSKNHDSKYPKDCILLKEAVLITYSNQEINFKNLVVFFDQVIAASFIDN